MAFFLLMERTVILMLGWRPDEDEDYLHSTHANAMSGICSTYEGLSAVPTSHSTRSLHSPCLLRSSPTDIRHLPYHRREHQGTLTSDNCAKWN